MPVTKRPSDLAYTAHRALYEGISKDRVERGLPALPPFPEPQPEVRLTAAEYLAKYGPGAAGEEQPAFLDELPEGAPLPPHFTVLNSRALGRSNTDLEAASKTKKGP
jgi:hypothetical protein